jgi:hypothetical protein
MASSKREPKEQRAIRLIRLLHAKGYSLRGIADRVKHRLGLKVSHTIVKAVLRREAVKAGA